MSRFVIAVLAFLLCTAPADAGWRVQRAQRIAVAYWGVSPCATVAVRWAQVPSPELTGVTDANVGAWVVSDSPCSVFFNSEIPTDWNEFCHHMLHEYGHLLGYPHTYVDTTSPMYNGPHHTSVETNVRGRIVRYVGGDPRCFDRGRGILRMRPGGYGWN